MKKCEVCGKESDKVSHEPSPSTLIFGPFRTQRGLLVTYQDRCPECEKKLADKLTKMLDEK